jgi:ASC-1-like (ASCH) protein
MHHVAIMKKSWNMVPKILSGEKTIESRWYQARRAPWGNIAKGDTVFFKNSGELVTAQATVSKVLQFEIKDLDEARKIVQKYGTQICLVNTDPAKWERLPKYCVLVFLEKPKVVKVPFSIDKKGFGSAAAWLTSKVFLKK